MFMASLQNESNLKGYKSAFINDFRLIDDFTSKRSNHIVKVLLKLLLLTLLTTLIRAYSFNSYLPLPKQKTMFKEAKSLGFDVSPFHNFGTSPTLTSVIAFRKI